MESVGDYIMVKRESGEGLHHSLHKDSMERVGDYIVETHGKAVVDILGAVLCHIGIFEDNFFTKLVLKREKGERVKIQ